MFERDSSGFAVACVCFGIGILAIIWLGKSYGVNSSKENNAATQIVETDANSIDDGNTTITVNQNDVIYNQFTLVETVYEEVANTNNSFIPYKILKVCNIYDGKEYYIIVRANVPISICPV